MPTPTDEALAILNTLHTHLATLVGATVRTLEDRRVSPWEGMQLSMQALAFGNTVLALCQGMDAARRQELLYVLVHAHLALDAEPRP